MEGNEVEKIRVEFMGDWIGKIKIGLRMLVKGKCSNAGER